MKFSELNYGDEFTMEVYDKPATVLKIDDNGVWHQKDGFRVEVSPNMTISVSVNELEFGDSEYYDTEFEEDYDS